jgi:hypothetical protein
MSSTALERMHKRARDVRARAVVRAFEYRQRRHAAGTWFRVRRVLARARTAYVVSNADAAQLAAEGFVEAPCGHELEPVKRLLFVDEARVSRLPARREIPVGLGPEFLEASAIALVPFERS